MHQIIFLNWHQSTWRDISIALRLLGYDLSADLHLTIVQRLKTTSILEGESCTFDCHLSHDVDDQPSWTINGQVAVTDTRIQVINNGRKYKMIIRDAMLTDAGDVVFTIKDLSCRTMLFVKGEYLLDVSVYVRKALKLILK